MLPLYMVSFSILSFLNLGIYAHQTLCPWNSQGKNTGVDSCSLFQGFLPTQGWNINLLHCRQILYHVNHQERLYFPLSGEMAFESHDFDFQKCVLVSEYTENDTPQKMMAVFEKFVHLHS